ncbi:MAG: peptidylprolyl isomerase, partial [Acidobacteriota bacterium]
MALAVAGGLWAASGLWAQLATGPTVRFNTSLGEIDVLLLPGSAPATVQNFLNYVRRGTYNNSIFHRSVPGFIIQGGGFTFSSGTFRALAADPPVRNEFRTSNSRGTIAMAKLGNNPNSATNQWFFNLANNASNLDNQNGGFTVFGRITNGLANMDRIAATPVFRLNSAELTDIPLLNFRSGQTVTESNVVFVRSITILDETPVPEIAPNGVISAGNFGGMPFAAPGSYIEIYGNNLGGEVSRGWNSADFVAGAAPQTLENVRVTAGGQLAFVNFVSKNQINVQLPASLPVGGNVDIVVTNRNEQSAAYSLPVR